MKFDIFEVNRFLMRAQNFILIIIISLFLGCSAIFAQDLDKQIKEYKNGSVDVKIDKLMEFHHKLGALNNDTVLFFVRDLQDEGIQNDREDALAMSNYVFGHYLNDHALFSEALDKLRESEDYYSFAQSDSMLSVVHNAIGNTYYLQSERKKAEEYYLSSIELGKRTGLLKFESLAYANLARIYIAQKKYDEARKLLDRYIELNKKESKVRNLGTAYGVYGQFYLSQNKFEESISHLERSMEYNLATGNNELIGNGYTNMAIASYFQENYDRSKSYFELALAYRKKEGKPFFIAESYFNLGDFFFGLNKIDSAEVAYKKSLEVSRKSDNLVGEKDALLQLSVLYDTINNPSKEVEMLREFIKVDQELDEQKISRELATLRLSFEQELRQKDFISHQREEELREKIDKVDTVWDYWLWIVLICVLTVAGFVFVAYRRTNQSK